ncbi:DNA-entry nuclease [Paenibacillus tepidiphilus]|uniref:DNA-entry nuclease n=1 Tax=Paenibacillus tepidiphilus TaxID=2608683 RepID=UPI001239F871|nr:DNA-entry nuclease [Paenibacillus tepidiphilus]
MAGDLRPHPESDELDGIKYDKHYRMLYHPEFHFNHRTPFTTEDLEYLCMFYEHDNARTMSFALGRTEHVCRSKYASLKKRNLVEYYRARYKRQMMKAPDFEGKDVE